MRTKTNPITAGTCNVPINMEVELKEALDYILKINSITVRNAVLKALVESLVTQQAVIVEGNIINVDFVARTPASYSLVKVREAGLPPAPMPERRVA